MIDADAGEKSQDVSWYQKTRRFDIASWAVWAGNRKELPT